MTADVGLAAQDPRLARRVGAVALVVIALAIGFFVFVYDRIEWGAHVRVRVYFERTGGLREGAPLIVGGREVGVVESIAPVVHGTPDTPLAGEEGVVATVAIDASFAKRLHRGGDWFVASRGALSAKYVELGPAPPNSPPIADGDPVRGRDPPTLDRVLQHTWDNMTTIARFASELSPEVTALRAQVDALRAQLAPTADSVDSLGVALARLGPLIGDAQTIASEARALRDRGLGGDAARTHAAALADRGAALVAEARARMGTLSLDLALLRLGIEGLRVRAGGKGAAAIDRFALAIDRARAVADKLAPLLAQVDALAASIARGDGSLLKLANDPEFPEDAKELGKEIKRHPWKVVGHPPNK
jgi:ABC-type transporter Mla subunit MlaD